MKKIFTFPISFTFAVFGFLAAAIIGTTIKLASYVIDAGSFGGNCIDRFFNAFKTDFEDGLDLGIDIFRKGFAYDV